MSRLDLHLSQFDKEELSQIRALMELVKSDETIEDMAEKFKAIGMKKDTARRFKVVLEFHWKQDADLSEAS